MNCYYCQDSTVYSGLGEWHCANHENPIIYTELSSDANHFFMLQLPDIDSPNNEFNRYIFRLFPKINKLDIIEEHWICYNDRISINDKQIYSGIVPENFSPEICGDFVNRLLRIKAFL